MKKTLIKTITIAALLFCYRTAYAKPKDIALQQRKIQADQIVFSSGVNRSLSNHRLFPMFAMQNRENLKTYHVGHKFFNSCYKVPTAKDLVDSIRFHPFFIGTFANELSHEECISVKDKIGYPFFIFETDQGGKNDFYMAHSKGVRHFTINILNERLDIIACLCNGADKNYPNLESFIKCTLKSHANKRFT